MSFDTATGSGRFPQPLVPGSLKTKGAAETKVASQPDRRAANLVRDPQRGGHNHHLRALGVLHCEEGVAFQVWAPHADGVSLIGSFNGWDDAKHPMERDASGVWFAYVRDAIVGDEFQYRIRNGDQIADRSDPRSRQVTQAMGHSVIHDPTFDWEGDSFEVRDWNRLVIYELRFDCVGGQGRHEVSPFGRWIDSFDRLRALGVGALQVAPVAKFEGDRSWGYSPAHLFAMESAAGGPAGFKAFVKAAHQAGFAVIVDVVYNHFDPSDLDLWQFDGWSQDEQGGIYYYNDYRSRTPWGETRPNYGCGEVRAFIRDNALMWFEEYRVDGLRYDMTHYMHSIDGRPQSELPDGWELIQGINREIHAAYPQAITIAADLHDNAFLTKPDIEGGAHFSAQWDAAFAMPIRETLRSPPDVPRSMATIRDALYHGYNNDVFERVVYTEPVSVNRRAPQDWWMQKRSALEAALVMTAPGIPMLLANQPWQIEASWDGLVQLYADLICLRTNRDGTTKGLSGQLIDVFHLDEAHQVLAFRRSDLGGVGDDVVVVLNGSAECLENYRIGFPAPGEWVLRFNSDAQVYGPQFSNHLSTDVVAHPISHDRQVASAKIRSGPMSALIYSQQP